MEDNAARNPPLCDTAEGIVSRLMGARARQYTADVLLAFDADGTLWSGDVGNDLFEALIAEGGVRDAAHEALVAEARAFGVRDQGNPTEVARALFTAYEAGSYPEDRAFAMMAWVFAGFSLDEAKHFSKNVTIAKKLEGRLHRFLDPVFSWAKRESVPMWVVSASAKWMVEIGVELLGIPDERVIGMTPRVRNGVIEPELDGLPIYGPNKPSVLRQACPHGVLMGAFGDSSYDAALLASACVPVAVRPKPGLLARAHEVPNLVVVQGD